MNVAVIVAKHAETLRRPIAVLCVRPGVFVPNHWYWMNPKDTVLPSINAPHHLPIRGPILDTLPILAILPILDTQRILGDLVTMDTKSRDTISMQIR